jgi:hypothetical protein
MSDYSDLVSVITMYQHGLCYEEDDVAISRILAQLNSLSCSQTLTLVKTLV